MAELNDDLIRQTRETAVVVEDALRSIASKIGDIFEETLTGANDLSKAFSKSLTKDITNSLNSLAKISTQLESNQVKLNAGSLKRSDIEKQILERKIKQNTLEAQLTIAARNGLITETEKSFL
jgi:Fe-S cluster assembly scaffold protein SufB